MRDEEKSTLFGTGSFPPLPENVFPREQLSSALTAKRGLTLLTGDAGTGKSTLAAQAVSGLKNCFVYQPEIADCDAISLARGLYRVLCGGTIADLTAEQLMKKLIEALRGSGALLVIDSLEKIGNQAGEEILLPLFRQTASGFNILVIARGAPGFMLPVLLDGTCRKVGSGDLYLDKQETGQWIRTLLPLEKDDVCQAYTDSLMQATAGWLAGIRLLIASICENRIRPGADPEGIFLRSGLRQYVISQILEKLPAEVAQFVTAAAVFPVLSAERLRAGLGFPDASDLLNRASDAGFPLLIGQNGEMRMVPVIREVLLRILGDGERNRLSRMAAAYALATDREEEAVGIACDAVNPELVCHFLVTCGRKLLNDRKSELLQRCTTLVEYTATDASVLDIAAQYHYMVGEFEKAEKLLSRADSMFGKENRYSACRTLYHGLHHFEEEPASFMKEISLALFTLREMKAPLPFLTEKDRRILCKVEQLNEMDLEKPEQKPLFVRMFGRFSVIARADGREIPWRTRKGCELFAYLVNLRGEAVDRDSLFNILWHEELPNNAVAMLHNMIYNIRKELSGYGLENMIRYANRKYSVDDSLIDTDMKAVFDVCDALRQRDIVRLAELAPVLTPYWGKYLGNIDDLWADEQKEYYDRMYIMACTLLGRKLREEGNSSEALRYYENAFAVDPYSEEIMAVRLSLLAEMGHPDKVKAAYESFCGLLEKELGIKPCEMLKNTYDSLIKRD